MFKIDTKKFVFSCLFTALIVVGGFISIPIGVVPVVLTDLFVFLSSSFQNVVSSSLSVALYLLMGIIGLPIYAGGKSGISVFLGPTGGFLIGYLFSSVVLSCLVYRKNQEKTKLWFYILSLLISNVVLYFFGIIGLMYNLKLELRQALLVGIVPFIPGTLLKSIVCCFTYKLVDLWHN